MRKIFFKKIFMKKNSDFIFKKIFIREKNFQRLRRWSDSKFPGTTEIFYDRFFGSLTTPSKFDVLN